MNGINLACRFLWRLSWHIKGHSLQGNNLWVPEAGTAGEDLKYENLAREMGVELGGWSFGAQFGDLNNDGYLDLHLTNGFVSAHCDKSYWYDFLKVAGGNSSHPQTDESAAPRDLTASCRQATVPHHLSSNARPLLSSSRLTRRTKVVGEQPVCTRPPTYSPTAATGKALRRASSVSHCQSPMMA